MKSVLTYGISWCAVRRRERALAEPGAAEAAVGDRVERLHELVALRSPAAAPASPVSGQKTLWSVQGWSQIVTRSRTCAISRSAAQPPTSEEPEPDEHEREARSRDVEHRDEDPEVEERRAEVVRRRRGRASPRPRSGAAARGPSAGPARAPRASRAGRRRGRRSARSSPARRAGTGTSRRAPRAARRSPSCRCPGSRGRKSSTIAPTPKRYL